MKRFLAILLFTGLAISAFPQRDVPQNLPRLDTQPIHFGYSLGLNMMDFSIRPSDVFALGSSMDTVYAVEVKKYVGFNINMIANVRLGKYFDLRFLPGLNFGQRTLKYKITRNGMFRGHEMMIESTYLDLPLAVKYRAERINNWRPFITGGASARVDLAAQKRIRPEEMPKIRLRPFDAYYELGIGVDMFLEYFMFGVELKASWGMLNLIQYDETQYTSYYDRLNSRMLLLSFHFEGGRLDRFGWKRKGR